MYVKNNNNTHTHTYRARCCVSHCKTVTGTRLNIRLYVHCLSCYHEHPQPAEFFN